MSSEPVSGSGAGPDDHGGSQPRDSDGTVHVPAYDLPLSVYMSEAARQTFRTRFERLPNVDPTASIAEMRQAMDTHFYAPRLAYARQHFRVEIAPRLIGGVHVAWVVPEPLHDDSSILINLHGGGFRIGAGMGALVESIPVAAVTGIQTVAVDYRQGPEHEFPAASEDVAAVYHALLERYPARRIGIFGTSAGGVLTAMTVVWLDRHNLPRPAAIALICAPADDFWGGDSRFTTPPLMGMPSPPPFPNPPLTGMPYVSQKDLYNPLVSPALSPGLLARFPPTLLITGTRAGEMSAVANSHARLIKAGVEAELHVWEGMWHGFLNDLELPEAQEALAVIARFFAKHITHT